MAETGHTSDKALGLGFVFGILSVLGAAIMYIEAANQLAAGWGFALAVLAGCIAVAAIHIFW